MAKPTIINCKNCGSPLVAGTVMCPYCNQKSGARKTRSQRKSKEWKTTPTKRLHTETLIQLALSSKDIPDDLRAVCDRINEHFPSRQQKTNWLWRTPFTTKHVKIDEEISEEKLYAQLDKRLEEVMAFETKLKELLE